MMMDASMRMSSILPTIKCSMCAQEIAISLMGDHVCATAEPLPPVPSQGRMNFFSRLDSTQETKTSRGPPALLDTRAANRPFTRQDEPSHQRVLSITRPTTSHSQTMSRSHTFNSIPEDEEAMDTTYSKAAQTYGLPSRPDQYLPAPQSYPEADSKFAPLSPRNVPADELLSKMNTIAPGPFDIRGRERQPAVERAQPVARDSSNYAPSHHSRPSTASSLRSHSSKASSASIGFGARPFGKPVERVGGYGGFGPVDDSQNNNLAVHPGMGARSQTLPNIAVAAESAANDMHRRPSDSAAMRRPSNIVADNNEELDGNRFVRTSPPRDARRKLSNGGRPPPRGQSFSAGRNISGINLAAEFGAANPYHAPSMSQSSTASGQSHMSKSSRSSPPTSADSSMRRVPSDAPSFKGVTNDLQTAIKHQPFSASPPKQQFVENNMVPPPTLNQSFLAPESPMDPAIHGGRLSPMPEQGSFSKDVRQFNGPPPPQQSHPAPQNRAPSPMRPGSSDRRGPSPSPSRAGPPNPQQRPPPTRTGLPGLPSHPSQRGNAPPRRPPPQNQPPNHPQDRRPPPPNMQRTPQGPPPHGPPRGQLPSPQHQDFQQQQRGRSQQPLTPSPQNQSFPQHRSPSGQRPPNGRPMPPPPGPPPQQRPTPPPEPAAPSHRPTPSRSTTPGSKGSCKGCSQPITGKSISSADGRLTGRYHKECFVCRTCRSPFATSEFYVINDAPYCERHYHKLNNSCCFACDSGIEGEYLETERRQKYHPHCLRCVDCRMQVMGEYFEMNGRVYCERDGMRRANELPPPMRGPGGRPGPGMRSGYNGMGGLGVPGMGPMGKMERRTTRLMMI